MQPHQVNSSRHPCPRRTLRWWAASRIRKDWGVSNLIDRYVAEVMRGVPEGKRGEVEQKVQTMIAAAVADASARSETPGDQSDVAAGALNDLGDPARLAATLTDSPQYLIGPGLYWEYRRLLGILMRIVPGTVAVVVASVSFIAGTSLWGALLDGLWICIVVALQVLLWSTVGFAIAEHTGTRFIPGKPWTVADLPNRGPRAVTLGQTVGAVLGLLVVGAMLVAGYFASPGESVPLLKPAPGALWLPALLALLLLQVVLALLAYARGHWTALLALLRIVGNVLFAAAAVTTLLTQQVFNPAFFAELGHPEWAAPGEPLARSVAWLIGVAVAIDLIDIVIRVWGPLGRSRDD